MGRGRRHGPALDAPPCRRHRRPGFLCGSARRARLSRSIGLRHFVTVAAAGSRFRRSDGVNRSGRLQINFQSSPRGGAGSVLEAPAIAARRATSGRSRPAAVRASHAAVRGGAACRDGRECVLGAQPRASAAFTERELFGTKAPRWTLLMCRTAPFGIRPSRFSGQGCPDYSPDGDRRGRGRRSLAPNQSAAQNGGSAAARNITRGP